MVSIGTRRAAVSAPMFAWAETAGATSAGGATLVAGAALAGAATSASTGADGKADAGSLTVSDVGSAGVGILRVSESVISIGSSRSIRPAQSMSLRNTA